MWVLSKVQNVEDSRAHGPGVSAADYSPRSSGCIVCFERVNMVMNYTEVEAKVREATNEDPWGPTGPQMQELSQYTYSAEHYHEVMSMLWKRMLVDNKTSWRRVYKVCTDTTARSKVLNFEKGISPRGAFIWRKFHERNVNHLGQGIVYQPTSVFEEIPTVLTIKFEVSLRFCQVHGFPPSHPLVITSVL